MGEEVELRVPAGLEYIPTLRELLGALCARTVPGVLGGVPEDWVWGFQTAVAELASNIVRHAHREVAGDLRWVLTAHEDRVEVRCFDRGTAYTPAPPSLPDPSALQEGGYGMFLIHRLLDDVEYTRTPDGENRWRLVKHLPPTSTEAGPDLPGEEGA